jgi:hypothetical protein
MGTTAAGRAEQGTSTGGGRVSERIFKKQPALQLATPEEESIQARRDERWRIIIGSVAAIHSSSFSSGCRGTTASRAEQGTSTGGGRVSERIFKKQPALQLATPEEESIQARRGERWWVIIREEVAEATPMTIESTRALMLPSCLSGFRFGF